MQIKSVQFFYFIIPDTIFEYMYFLLIQLNCYNSINYKNLIFWKVKNSILVEQATQKSVFKLYLKL